MATSTRRKRSMTRAQLEALAAGNPRVAERMAAGEYEHRLADTTADDPVDESARETAAREPGSRRPEPLPAAAAGSGRDEQPATWPQDAAATGADLEHIDGEPHLILWADGADDEHPTVGIPITDDALLDLSEAVERLLGDDPEPVDRDDPEPVELEAVEIRGRDLDRPLKPERTWWGLGPETTDPELDEHALPGRVDLDLVTADGRQLTVHLGDGQARFLARWLNPQGAEKPLVEFAIDSDGNELRHTAESG